MKDAVSSPQYPTRGFFSVGTRLGALNQDPDENSLLASKHIITEAKQASIIIPSWRRPDLLQRSLASLVQQTLGPENYEIVVVENEARPEMVAAVQLPANARLIALAENLGTTGAINRALQQSSSQYVLLLNNDVELDSRFLQVLIALLDRNPACGFATGKLLNARQRDRLDGAGDALLCGGGSYRLGHGDPDRGQFDQVTSVLAGCGAATLFRRSLLDEIGGLDEDFFAYLDDIDIALRAQLAGYHGIYTPDAVAWHAGSATLGDVFHPRIAELLTRNQIFLLLKDYPAGAFFRLLGHIVWFQLLWLVLVIRNGRVLPYMRGLAGALRSIPRMMGKRRAIMRTRRISSAQFMALLRASERQIFDWQAAVPPYARSGLLRAYFRLFRPRP